MADQRSRRRDLFVQAASQGGFFTAAQAKDIGYSYQAQAHHVAAGNWTRIDHGLFRLTDWTPEPDDDLRRWTLWSRGVAVVSHQSALAVHGIGEFESSRIHLTVPASFRKTNPVLALHRGALANDEIEEHRGFATTTVLRSMLDVAALSPDAEQLAAAIDEALAEGRLTRRMLRAAAESIDPLAALHVERALTLNDGAQ